MGALIDPQTVMDCLPPMQAGQPVDSGLIDDGTFLAFALTQPVKALLFLALQTQLFFYKQDATRRVADKPFFSFGIS